jgi:lipoate-protein ligase A
MKILRSLSDSPAFHCDLERQLLTERAGEDVLLLYINRPAVIVGRNQQVEAEVDRSYCDLHGIEIIRRITGGGAVYHDYGNINYAFIVDRDLRQPMDMDFTSPVLSALSAAGVEATAGARKELLVDGRKISGTASLVTGRRILFHGTLLHNTNLNHLSLALRGEPARRGKHIASVPSDVMNLSEITGADESTPQFLERIVNFLTAYYTALQ